MNNFELILTNHFNKTFSEITTDELNKLEILSLDGINIFGIKEEIQFDKILELLPNLKKIHLSNYTIRMNDIKLLSNTNINHYDFYKCNLISNDIELLNKAKFLNFEKCHFDNYSFINNNYDNLLTLSIITPNDEETINLSNIKAPNLKELIMQECIIENFSGIENIKSCELLNILWSSFDKNCLSYLEILPNLKELFISREFANNDIIKKLQEKNISIYNDLNIYSTFTD